MLYNGKHFGINELQGVQRAFVVLAESTPRQIAEAVMSHVPGRRFCQPGG
jgi:hypothetical protein